MTTRRRPRPSRAALVLVAVLAAAASLGAGPAHAEDPPAGPAPVAVVTAPTVTGTARYDSLLTATTGTWDPADAATTYRWLRDGTPITGATASTYRLVSTDIGRRVSVRVTATAPDRAPGEADSAPTAVVGTKVPVLRSSPSISGTRRYGSTLTASPGRWSVTGLTFSYRWLRDGVVIPGAYRRTYAPAPGDVGHRLSVRIGASRRWHTTVHATSSRTAAIAHRRDVRRTVTYRVTRNGSTASLATFRALAAETLADARGWRGGGVRFKEVSSGGSFTLVLAKASRLPSYSSACSVRWSCRVGRNVIINETRWNSASPAWNRAGGSLRGYRHMVVNHEVGHFLGKGHASCGGRGRLAPVMQQQSKGLGGCRFNPWPLLRELKGL